MQLRTLSIIDSRPQDTMTKKSDISKTIQLTSLDYLFKNDEFEKYCLARPKWEISTSSFKLSYLLEKHLTNSKEYENNIDLFLQLISAIGVLIDECQDLSKVIKMPVATHEWFFSEFSLPAVAVRTVNKCLKEITDEQHQFYLFELLQKIRLQAPSVYMTPLKISDSIWKSAVDKDNQKMISIMMPFLDKETRNKLFKYALSLVNITIVNAVINYEYTINKSYHQKWLKKLGAWPLIEVITHTKKRNATKFYPTINDLLKDVAHNFPINNDPTTFNLLFPFCNEDYYDKVLQKLIIINKLRKSQVTQHKETDKIGVAILFGQSNFLSILPELSNFSDVIILADIVEKQHKHIKHMLDCMCVSESPEEFIKNYLENNPILNERVGSTDINLVADINYLTRNIKRGGSTKEYNFLSTQERFHKCKQAAKKLSFAQITLDLMNSDQCSQLADLLASYNATIEFCNFTNIHTYDESLDKLNLSTPKLLGNAENCLIMYATGIDSFRTHIAQGLEYYFSSCLGKNYIAPTSKDSKDPMLGFGVFSSAVAATSSVDLGHDYRKITI